MGHKSITQFKSSCTGSIKFTEIIKNPGLIIFLGVSGNCSCHIKEAVRGWLKFNIDASGWRPFEN